MIFIFVFENCQNLFSWGPPLVHFGLQNNWILEVKSMRSMIFIFVFENCQNLFSWGPLLVHFGLQNTWIWRWNLWDQNFVLFDLWNIHIEESQIPGFTSSIEFENKFQNFLGNLMVKNGRFPNWWIFSAGIMNQM